MARGSASDVRCCTACGAVYRAEYARCLNDGAELVMLDRDPLVGNAVGPYVVDALLGEGGMGRVYRVHHARLTQKRYALKVLLGDYAATPPMRMRFAKEAQSASRLSHPNVVAVCDFGVTDAGLAYLAMDLVEGTPLSELVSNQPMAPQRVIHLAHQLCMGLAHAHDLGLIHRDFKPDNIIVVDGPAGEVPRIADFGLAITTDSSDVRLTTSGMVLGTPAYVAPEQVTGGDVDHRADLYALGTTMFELLSGGFLPFDGDPVEVVGLKATMPAPRIAELAADLSVPPALASIVDRLLARRPRDRYPDARAVVDALDEAVRFPDDATLAGAPAERRRPGDTDAHPAHRRADRADDAAVERGVTPPVPLARSEARTSDPGPRESRGTGGRTDRVRAAPTSRRRRVAILAGAIVLAGAIAGAAVWFTPSADPASADPPGAGPPGAEPPAPAIAAARPTAEPPPPAEGASPAPAPPEAARAPASAAPPAPRRSERSRPPKRTTKAPPGKRTATAAPAPPAPEVEPAPAPPPEPTAAPPAVISPPPAPPLPAPPAPPAPPASLEPRFAGLDVHGALPNATVRRALDRVLAGARACRSDRAGAAEVRFTIGESRRAAGLRGTGLTASRCLATALSGLRTDTAPDVGDVEVLVHFTYDPPP